jgi:hypothetical protein
LIFDGTATEPCPNGSGGTATDHYLIRLTPQRAGGTVARLVGTETLESIDLSQCKNVTNEPVAFSYTATRR